MHARRVAGLLFSFSCARGVELSSETEEHGGRRQSVLSWGCTGRAAGMYVDGLASMHPFPVMKQEGTDRPEERAGNAACPFCHARSEGTLGSD